MNWVERLYERSPPWLQNAGLTFHGWRIRRHRYGRRCQRELARLLEAERWPHARIREFQDRRLRRLVSHAFDRSPFYKSILEGSGVRPEDIRGVDDLHKLPIIDKEHVRSHGAEMLTRRPRRDWLAGHTSGTTGSPLTLWYDRPTCVMTNAVDKRHKVWAGMNEEDWIGLFLGRIVVPVDHRKPPFWRVNHALKQVWFSTFHLSDENLPGMVAEIRRRGLEFLEGYPSTLYVVASFLRRRGETLPMRAVITSSETLHPMQRETIERAFGCRLYDFYAMAERVVFAGECDEHDGKHVAELYGLLEIVDAHGEAQPPGKAGLVVGTSLHNFAMPMLRYRMGDVSAVSAEPCRCGRTLSRMEEVATKAEDIVVTPDGRWISPSILTHPFKPLHRVRESQVVQDAIDHVTVKIVPEGQFSAEEESQLRASLGERLGDLVHLDIEIVEEIQREPSGKFRWVVSEIPHDLKVRWT